MHHLLTLLANPDTTDGRILTEQGERLQTEEGEDLLQEEA